MPPCPALSDLCPAPLSGKLCEVPPRPPAPGGPCEGMECQNGASCMDQGSRAVCQCLPGFGGPECEKLLSVNFVDRDTYLQFTDLQNWPRANITLQVRAQGAGRRGEPDSGGPFPAQDGGRRRVGQVFGAGVSLSARTGLSTIGKATESQNQSPRRAGGGGLWVTGSRKPHLAGSPPAISCLSFSLASASNATVRFLTCGWSSARVNSELPSVTKSPCSLSSNRGSPLRSTHQPVLLLRGMGLQGKCHCPAGLHGRGQWDPAVQRGQ